MKQVMWKVSRTNNDILHYGILGMKWGVRRTPEQLGHKPDRKYRKVTIDGREVPVGRVGTMVDYSSKFAKEQIRKDTTDMGINKRIDELLDWEKIGLDNTKQYAKDICKDVVRTRKNEADRHKHLSRVSLLMDSAVFDDPSVMAVDKKTGRMRYNSCVKFDINGIQVDSKTGKYNTQELDNILNEIPDSMYYYVWGELLNRE